MVQAKTGGRDYSYEEYVKLELESKTRHEFYHGAVYAMAGTSDTHNEITLNLSLQLRNKSRKGDCKLYTESVKLELEPQVYYVYPDVFITGDPQDMEDRLLKRHPVLIVEVLSDSTEKYDRGFK